MLPGVPGQRGRLLNKMTNLRQDRVPKPTLAHTSPPSGEQASANGRPVAAGSIVLSLRLRIPDSSGSPIPVSWGGDSPAAALAIDILAASGAVPDPPKGAVLESRFSNLQSALLAARRLQWALEGLAAGSGVATAAAMVIHAAADPVAGSATHTLERLSPGQVLLSAGLADPVQQVPGFVVRPAFDGHWRELQWQPQEPAPNLAADEQSVLGLIRALGRQDPCPPPVEAPAPAAVAPAPVTTGVYQAPPGLGRSLVEAEDAATPFWKKPWVLVSAGAALLVLLAAVIIPTMISHPKVQVPSTATTPAPMAPPVTPSSGSQSNTTSQPNTTGPVTTEKPHPQKPAGKSPKQPKVQDNAEGVTEQPPPPPKQGSSSCDLTEAEIPLSLQRAQRLMYAGKLEDAQDAFQHLAGCPSARDKALDGLRQVKQRMSMQSN